MFKKIVSMITAFALVIAGINFTPSLVDAAVTSANGSSSWKLVWNDEFNQTVGGAPDKNVWSYDTGNHGWGNNEIQNYTTSTQNVSIADLSSDSGSSDGRALAIKAIRQGSEITSGRIKTIGKQYLKYGKVEAKIRVANSMQSGVWPAFWMMGNSMNSGTGWPYCGEIDIMEHRNAEQQIIGTLHWNTGTGTSAGYHHVYRGSETTGNFAHIDSMEDWHKYGIEWYENQIKFFLDDVCYQTLDTTSAEMEEFRESHFMLLNLAIGGPNSPFTLGQTVGANFTDATMYVDYVRVYQGSDSDFYIAKKDVQETSQEPTTVGDGLTVCSGEKTNLGGWGYYILGGNSAKYAGGSSLSEDFTLKVVSSNKGTWSTQAFTQNMSVTSGHTYNVSVDIDSSAASDPILMKDEIGGTEMVNKALIAGKNTFTGTFTPNSNTAQLMFNLGGVNSGTTLKFSNVVLTDITGSEAPVETTTESTQTGAQEWVVVNNSNDIFFYDKAGMTNISGVVNVQKPGFAAEEGIYITVPSGITSVSVNGKTENVAANQGAGTVVYLSALTQQINKVIIYQGEATSTITIKNVNGTGSTEPDETTQPEETTTEAVSSIAAPSDVAGYNFYAQSKGYMINFTPVTDAVSYNVSMDNSGVLANITASGEYVDASVFSAYADGQLHDLYLQSVDAQGGVSAKSAAAKVRVTQETDSASDPADISRIYVVTNSGAKGGANITKADKTSASLTIISGESGIKTVSNAGTIKRRGNSTSLADKPAYNISFNKKAEVIEGRAKGKKWSLLANAYEKTLIRNKLAMDLGLYAGGIAAAAEYYADLYIDGEYQGNYVISEPAECGRSGCEYDDSETSDELLFEWEDNDKTEDECLYYRAPRTNVRFVTEDTVDTSSTRYQKWVSTLTTFENALVNTSSDDVLNYMDVDSFVSMYVVNEFFQTVDFGYSSVKFYITYDAAGAPTIHAGPLWDFDLSSGNTSVEDVRTYNTFRGQNVNAWFGYLMKNNTFKNKVIEKYKQLQPRIQNIYKDNQLGTNQITKLTTSIEASRIRNYSSKDSGGAGWSESAPDSAEYAYYPYSYSTVAPYNTYTYAQHIDYLRKWLQNRNEWICSQWGINPADYDGEEETTPEVTTPEETTPEETTPETTTPSTDAYTQLEDGVWTNVGDSGKISIYAGTWGNGRMSYSGTTDSDLKLRIDSSNGAATESWGIQLKNTLDLVEGKEYTIKVNYTSSKAGKLYYKIDGPEIAQEFDAVAGNNTAELTVTATAGNIAVLALSGFEAGTVISNLSFEVVSTQEAGITISTDINVVGYQISTTYEGIRVAAGVEPTINGQAVENWGFVYGLMNYNTTETGITDDDMYVGADNPFIKSYQSTSVGTIDAQLGESSTATYFARTMKFGADNVTAYTANYKVRAYAVLADGSYVYSEIADYSIARVADKLYQDKLMNTITAHNYLYENILSKVYPGYEEVDYNWNNAVVKPEQM